MIVQCVKGSFNMKTLSLLVGYGAYTVFGFVLFCFFVGSFLLIYFIGHKLTIKKI